ncbi:probable ATP-dependent RNA helicase DDX28 [Apis dorsata]|uniref:probable ATP-dependent RNA helicase DDX28 n=1 Tax=Apis dorsata TaxID=7462 RepID=UPI001293343B|nr:probable ATP-dependent RNA helicase DDX28 [Apis dorsata]
MLFRFCHIGCKTINISFVNFTRHYARALVKSRKKKNEIIDNEVKNQEKKIPIILSKKKLYDFYTDDIHIKKKLILASHGWKNRKSKNDHFFIYPYHNDKTEINKIDFEAFEELNINNSVCNNLENLDIYKPSEIQKLGIPKILRGYNVLLAAETGCGKTLTYLLPLVTKILIWKQNIQSNINSPFGLIITPSRELAVQIALELIKISKDLDIKIKIITGGRTKKILLNPPVGHVDILVCSFGVISKLTTFGVYNLKFVRFVVLDEADSLFHHSFEEKLRVFMKRIYVEYRDTTKDEFTDSAQLILTSATIPSRMKNVLNGIVNLDSLKHITTEKLHKILVPQKFMRLIPSEKPVQLLKYVKPKVLNNQRIIVFCNQNSTSYWLSSFLHECGIKVTNLNGDMPLSVRRGKYGEFINGKTMVLSMTNGGSRGLNTVMVNHILNYDFPLDTASYIHRCGRTGRIGTIGACRVTNFISRVGEVVIVQKIEMAARKMKPIPLFNLMDKEEEELEIENDYIEEIIEDLQNVENIPY